jgi:hypothetical protein
MMSAPKDHLAGRLYSMIEIFGANELLRALSVAAFAHAEDHLDAEAVLAHYTGFVAMSAGLDAIERDLDLPGPK